MTKCLSLLANKTFPQKLIFSAVAMLILSTLIEKQLSKTRFNNNIYRCPGREILFELYYVNAGFAGTARWSILTKS